MDPFDRLRIGTRASPLARWQAQWVANRLARLGVDVQLLPMTTHGDQQTSRPVGGLAVRGVFTTRIQQALLAGEIDLAVHSLKDLPTEPIEGLLLAAVPERADVADVLISRQGETLERLPAGALVGTGSLRRRAQLRHLRPDIQVADVRGNVGTRLRKLDRGDYDALLLAAAGLERLELAGRVSQRLSPHSFLPAVGQGALAVECRADDQPTRRAVAALDDPLARSAVVAERTLLAALRGGCLAPVGAWARPHDGPLLLSAVVLSGDGRRRLERSESALPAEAEALGRKVAQRLLADGAGDLIEAAREASGQARDDASPAS